MSTPHNEPNESSLRPPEDTADDDSSFLSSSRSRSSAETTIRGPATNFHQRTPAYTYYNRKRLRRLLAVKRSTRRKANDPYDYEQKYPEDEEFHEMGPRARIWKIFWDECTKYDSDMVEDWRDGLDVLLVFAGLFSAVVSTFVAQTCQSLQLNWSQVSASLTFELIHVQRAIAKGHDVDDVPSSQLDPNTAVQSTRTDVWVNALWFTSLALSLTTALIAVLTKQWIHQYMSVPSGTPRDRSRIRQFRYNCLKHWRVPVIVGLLPVLMHLALRIFFSGLVIYLRSLNYAMSYVVTTIAVMAFIVYFGTNLIPWFRPECPYKTPLSQYTYPLFSYLRRRIFPPQRTPNLPIRDWWEDAEDRKAVANYKASMASSLKVAEREKVVLQAISGLPLQSTHALVNRMPCLRDEIVQVCNEYVIPAKQSHAQRFHRALHRIESVVPSDSWVEAFAPTFVNPADKYRKLLNDSVPEPAIAFLRSQILSSGDDVVSLDVHMWAMLLRAALFGGSEWLEINVEGSDIWSNLMVWLMVWLTANDVARPYTNHGERRPELIGFDIFLSTYREPSGCHISIIDLPDTNDPLPLNRAIQKFMYVSICDTIVRLGFPSLCQGEDYSNVPGDIRLHLALIQSSCAQKTSTPWDRAAGDLETSEMSHVLGVLRSYLNYELTFGGYKVKEQYPSSVRAIYLALRDVVTSDTFGRSTTLTQRDERNILALLFRAGNMLDSSHAIADSRWITDSVLVLEKMQHVLFGETSQENLRLPCQLLADAVAYAQKSRSSNLFPTLGVKLYTGLMKQDWLSLLLGRYRNPGNGSYYWLPWSEDLSYPAIPFLVSAYMDGLEQLRPVAPELFEAVLKSDLRSTLICSTLCATLLLADVERQKCLETVRSFIEPETWLKSFHTAAAFLRSEAGIITYQAQSDGRRLNARGCVMKFSLLAELDTLVLQLLGVPTSNQSATNKEHKQDEFPIWTCPARTLCRSLTRDLYLYSYYDYWLCYYPFLHSTGPRGPIWTQLYCYSCSFGPSGSRQCIYGLHFFEHATRCVQQGAQKASTTGRSCRAWRRQVSIL